VDPIFDLGIGFWFLVEGVAWNIDNLQTLGVVFVVDFSQLGIADLGLTSQGSRVKDKGGFVLLELREFEGFAINIGAFQLEESLVDWVQLFFGTQS